MCTICDTRLRIETALKKPDVTYMPTQDGSIVGGSGICQSHNQHVSRF